VPRKPRPVRMEGVYATPMASRPPTEKYPERWYWRARATVDGREGSLFAGRYTRPEVVIEIGRRIAAGLLLEHEPTEVETMGDLINAWGADMADRPDLAQSTRASMVRALRRVMPLIEGVRVVDMGARHVERAHRTLLRSYAPSSARLSLRYVGQVRVYNHHTPTGEDVAATVAAMPDGWVQEIARLLWATGCRLGEVLYLEWSAIEIGPRPHIRVTGKTGARRVPLSDAAAARLRALHATRDPGWPCGMAAAEPAPRRCETPSGGPARRPGSRCGPRTASGAWRPPRWPELACPSPRRPRCWATAPR